jgi:predicted hotdog family 3-hydroxylacyl-ACP dehydratase
MSQDSMTCNVDVARLIPHQGGMCLLQTVLQWDEQRIALSTTTQRAADHPLRSNGRLRAVHLCEYGAQAMAVHGALKATASGLAAAPGMLVSLRSVDLHCDYIDDLPEALEVRAQCLQATDSSLQYTFEVLHGQQLLAQGRAAVVLRQPGAGVDPAG